MTTSQYSDSKILDYPEVISRKSFLSEYWDYEPGQHVTIIGPNGRGKTTLGFQLLGATITPQLQCYALISKPRDETIDEWIHKLRLQQIRNYPPPPRLTERFRKHKIRGYALRPYQTLKDLEADERALKEEFRECLRTEYGSKRPVILFADEAQELQDSLKLRKELEAYWKRGRSLDSGLWALAQRSAYNSQDMYNAPEHLFLFNDPDKRNRQRFSEIGGVDPGIVMEVTNSLSQYQTLYIKRTGPCLCIVDP